jgi:NitT/TauT family transport system permease protein
MSADNDLAVDDDGHTQAPWHQRANSQRLVVILLPVITLMVFMALWQAVVTIFDIKEYIVPAPSVFIRRFIADFSLLWTEALITGQAVLAGFALAAVVSIPLALLMTSVRILRLSLYPLLIFLQIIPKIAVAPLLIVWFGFGEMSKFSLTFLLCFFPILVDSMAGFRTLDERLLYLTRSMGANAWQTFWYIRFKAALPFIFAGLQVAMVFAVTGAIVAEFVGSNSGLGYVLLRASGDLDTPLMFATLLALSIMGLLFTYAVTLLERISLPWQHLE